MPASKNFSHEPRSHPLIFLAAVAVAGIMIYPFIVPLILSVITAYVFNPIIKRLEVHTRSYHIALGILVIIIGLPIIFAVSYLSANAALFFQDIAGFGDKLKEVISALSNAIAGMGFGTYTEYFLTAQDITSKIIDFIKAYASTLPAEDEHFVSSILSGLKRGFDVLFLTYITTSLIITAASFIGYSVFGAPHAFLLALLTGLFGFLPIFGVWMVYVPVAAYMYYIGNVFAAAGIMVFGVVVLTIFIPFILQPYMGAKKTGVNALTILLGFFSGSIIFGAKGLLLGPILFVITETIIVEYMRYRISGHENIVLEAQS